MLEIEGDMQKYNYFFISLLNSTKDVKPVVKKIKILDVVFVVKNAFEKSLRPALIFLSGCGQIRAERYVTSLKEPSRSRSQVNDISTKQKCQIDA